MNKKETHQYIKQMSLFDAQDISKKELQFIDKCANIKDHSKFSDEHIELMKNLIKKYWKKMNDCGFEINS